MMMSETVICDHCVKLQVSFASLQQKEEKLRIKMQALSNAFTDLKLQNQCLRDENALLKVLKPVETVVQHPTEAVTRKVEVILEEIGEVLTAQGDEITQLIDDRDKLVNACFKTMALASKQELVIDRFTKATSKMCSFIGRRGETATSVSREFAMLGIDVANDIDDMHRRFKVQEVCRGDGARIDDDGVLNVMDEIGRLNADDESLKVVVDYVKQQVDVKAVLRGTIRKEKRKVDGYKVELEKVSAELKMSEERHQDEIEIAKKFREMKRLLRLTQNSDTLLRQVIAVIVKFAAHFDDDLNVICCIQRMKRWVDNHAIGDIARDLCFLLGMIRDYRGLSGVTGDRGNKNEKQCEDDACIRSGENTAWCH